jgi:hypothetical protein
LEVSLCPWQIDIDCVKHQIFTKNRDFLGIWSIVMLAVHSRQYSGLFSFSAQIIFPPKAPIAPGRSA